MMFQWLNHVKPLEVGRLMAPLFFPCEVVDLGGPCAFCPTRASVLKLRKPGILHNCWSSSCFSSAGFAQIPSVFPQIGRVFFFFFLLSNPVCSVASPAYIITVASSTQHHPCSIPPHPTHVQRDIFSVASSLYHHHRVLVSVHVHQHPTAPQPCLQRSIINVPSSSRASVHIRQYTTAPHPIPPPHSIFSAASST